MNSVSWRERLELYAEEGKRFTVETIFTYLFYYGNLIEQHQLYFRIPDDKPSAGIKLNSGKNLLLGFADLSGYIFAIAAMLFYWFDGTSQGRYLEQLPWLDIVCCFMPPQGRRNMLLPVIIVAVSRFIFVHLILSYNLTRYRFMAIFAARANATKTGITYRHIGLSLDEFRRLYRFRRRATRVFLLLFTSLVLISCVGRFRQAFRQNIWHRNKAASLFWAAAYFAWIWNAASFTYAPPFCFLTVSFYIWLKQNGIEVELDKLSATVQHSIHGGKYALNQLVELRVLTYRRFLSLLHRSEHMCREIDDYNKQIGPCLTVLFGCYTAMTSYAFSFMLFRRVLLSYRIAYWFVFLTHIAGIAMLTFGCGRIVSHRIGWQVRHHLELAATFYTPCQRLHMQTSAATLLYTKMGFTMLNYTRVKSATFFTILTYSSSLFFLAFRNN